MNDLLNKYLVTHKTGLKEFNNLIQSRPTQIRSERNKKIYEHFHTNVLPNLDSMEPSEFKMKVKALSKLYRNKDSDVSDVVGNKKTQSKPKPKPKKPIKVKTQDDSENEEQTISPVHSPSSSIQSPVQVKVPKKKVQQSRKNQSQSRPENQTIKCSPRAVSTRTKPVKSDNELNQLVGLVKQYMKNQQQSDDEQED